MLVLVVFQAVNGVSVRCDVMNILTLLKSKDLLIHIFQEKKTTMPPLSKISVSMQIGG